MSRVLVTWFLLLVLYVLDASVLPWFMPAPWFSGEVIVPQLVLTGIIYTAIYSGRHMAAVCGVTLGLLQDVTAGAHLLGPHAFALGFVGYLAGLTVGRRTMPIFYTLLTMLWTSVAYTLCLFEIYRLFRVIQLPFMWNLLHQTLPVILFDLFASLLLYFPAKAYFEHYFLRKTADDVEE